jgi:rRNA maturation protein Nop10
MNLKKIALIALLIAVIAAAAVLAVRRARSELKTPLLFQKFVDERENQKLEKIDMKSLEVFSETVRDWATQYAPNTDGYYKNPKTGEYTVVEAMKCASCGQLIPAPQLPAGLAQKMRGGRNHGPSPEAIAEMVAVKKSQSNYKCPRCGKNAFGPRPSPPTSK